MARRPPRVLLDARPVAGGPGIYARELLRGLAAVHDPDLDVRVVQTGRALIPGGGVRLASAARRQRPDLVHGLHLALPPGSARGVVTIHDLVPLDHAQSVPSPVRRLLYRRVLARSLGRAVRIIVPSTLTRDRLVEHGVASERLTVVPLAVGPRFRPLDEAERDQARRDFAGGRPYVVASSGPRAHKNLSGLDAAAALLPPGVPVVVAGLRPEQSGTDHLRLLGRLGDDDLARFYGGAEVMVLPAVVEGFGLPALEAMACGVPVVCGPKTGALDVLAAGALVVDVTRPRELAAAIEGLVGDRVGRSRLAEAGWKEAAALTPERMARATLAVYREVLAQRSVTATR